MRELILEACRNNDERLFSELMRTFPVELVQAEFTELQELGSRYRQQFEELNIKWDHRFRVNWHGEWVDGLRLVSPPVESKNPLLRCQAWHFASSAGQKYYAWTRDDWSEIDFRK